VVLRRTDCYLVGQGQIALGCDRNADDAPVASFAVVA
jgi:adenylate cyclase